MKKNTENGTKENSLSNPTMTASIYWNLWPSYIQNLFYDIVNQWNWSKKRKKLRSAIRKIKFSSIIRASVFYSNKYKRSLNRIRVTGENKKTKWKFKYFSYLCRWNILIETDGRYFGNHACWWSGIVDRDCWRGESNARRAIGYGDNCTTCFISART